MYDHFVGLKSHGLAIPSICIASCTRHVRVTKSDSSENGRAARYNPASLQKQSLQVTAVNVVKDLLVRAFYNQSFRYLASLLQDTSPVINEHLLDVSFCVKQICALDNLWNNYLQNLKLKPNKAYQSDIYLRFFLTQVRTKLSSIYQVSDVGLISKEIRHLNIDYGHTTMFRDFTLRGQPSTIPTLWSILLEDYVFDLVLEIMCCLLVCEQNTCTCASAFMVEMDLFCKLRFRYCLCCKCIQPSNISAVHPVDFGVFISFSQFLDLLSSLIADYVACGLTFEHPTWSNPCNACERLLQ